MSIEKFLIDDNIIEAAQLVCNDISDNLERSRAVSNVVGARSAYKYFKHLGIEVDIQSGLHNIPNVLEYQEISDVYLNDAYIDVRMCSDLTELSVPVSHYTNDLIPDAYMFIKIEKDLSSFEVLGFILPESLKRETENDGYYAVDSEMLLSFDEIKEYIENAHNEEFADESEMLEYLDGTLSNPSLLFKKLISSQNSRLKFIQLYNAQCIFNLVRLDSDDSVNDQEEFITESELDAQEDNNSQASDFEYATVTTPSLDLNYQDEPIEPTDNSISEKENFENDNNENSEIVNNLYPNSKQSEMSDDESFSDEGFDINAVRAKQKRKPLITMLIATILIAVAGVGSYFAFQNVNGTKNETSLPLISDDMVSDAPQEYSDDTGIENNAKDAMPVETVEKQKSGVKSNEGNAMQVPEIERNLDASVLVSNLKIDWEVPAGYASNTSATRYFVKLGKIIQLNLKTELLLLNKPPLSNKIAIELKYNNVEKSFEVNGVTVSSGETVIDDLIVQTVKKALKMKLNSNLDAFGKIPGNPVLIIKL